MHIMHVIPTLKLKVPPRPHLSYPAPYFLGHLGLVLERGCMQNILREKRNPN